MVSDKQVQKYRRLIGKGLALETAAARAGMDPKTARNWRTGRLPSEKKAQQGPRGWRTRPDPFAAVWETIVLPYLQADEEGVLEASYLFEHLKEENPGDFPEASLRTFQRRVADYRAIHGPAKEVFFQQTYKPGVTAQLDFTHLSKLFITIKGQPLNRLLFECVLCYSGQRHVALVPSESYEALNTGLQGAFLAWGGTPVEVVQDHLSAAIHNLKAEGEDRYVVNERYQSFLSHFGVQPRFIEVAKPNQNGCVERGHGVLKNLLEQALKLRRRRDFASLEDFENFLLLLVGRLNRKRADRWEEERKHLRPLPSSLPTTYSELTANVSRWSLIQVKGNTISVPSRLIGHDVKVRVNLDTLEIYYKDHLVERLPRPVGRGQVILNYRHLVPSLVRKPGAFANYRYHEHMFPKLPFRKAYDALKQTIPKKADLEYLRILKLAAEGMECDVEAALQLHLDEALPITSEAIAGLVARKAPPRSLSLAVPQPDLKRFDHLLTGETRERLIA
jgi:transposase